MKQFRKILITLAILSYVELFGLINADDDLRIPGGMKLYDIFTFLIILHRLLRKTLL